MAEGLTLALIVEAAAVAGFSLWTVRRYLPGPVALLVCAVKIAIPVIYFAWFQDGTWVRFDDRSYLLQGATLVQQGYDPVTILFTAEGLGRLWQGAGGAHLLYPWWNLLAQYVFGMHYYAPVLMNVGLTCVAGTYVYRLARLAGFSRRYGQGLATFFLLHWDVLAWSSIMNLKEPLVLALLAAAAYHVQCLPGVRQPGMAGWRSIVSLGLIMFAMLWVRFYLPLLFATACAAWALLKIPGRRKYVVLAVAAALLLIVLPRVPGSVADRETVSGPLTIGRGLITAATDPGFWAIDPSYGFLVLPAFLHWLLLAPAVMGGYYLYGRSRTSAFVIVLLVVGLLFYAAVPELRGVRQRFMLVFAIAWMQFAALRAMFAIARGAIRRPAGAPLPQTGGA